MSKKKAPPGLTNLERFGGGVFFVRSEERRCRERVWYLV